jgi:peptide/nickel transport system substrate-binding protein
MQMQDQTAIMRSASIPLRRQGPSHGNFRHFGVHVATALRKKQRSKLMQSMQRRLLVALLMLGMELVPSLPAESASQNPKLGGTLTMGVQNDLRVTNPLVNTRSTQGRIYDLIYEPLLTLDLKGNVRPNLAESWQISPDGRLVTFSLRKAVVFHDGREMTAEDVKFVMDYVMNPKNGASGFNALKIVAQVETTDKHTLRVHLKAPSAAFLASLTALRAFSVVPKGSIPEGIDKITTFPAGTGPFRFIEWKPSQRIVLQRHDGHWGHKAFLDTLVFKPVRDDTARFAALRAGDVDMIERTTLEWAKEIVEGKLRGIGIAQAPQAELVAIGFNVAAPPFDNKKLRRALAHGVDKKEVLQGTFHGFGETTEQRYAKGHAWYIDEVKGFPYDPAKARALLKEAGYNGQPIKLTVDQTRTKATVAAVVQAQLKKIGVNIEVEVIEDGLDRSRARTGEYQFRVTGGGFYPDPYETYGPDFVCPENLKLRSSNLTGYCDKEMDALIQKILTEHNPERRRTLVRQVAVKLVEDAPVLYIGYVPLFHVFQDYVKGFTTDGDGNFRYLGGGLGYTWLDK